MSILHPSTFTKAIAAFVVGGLGVLYTASLDNVITLHEWVGVGVTAFGAFAATYLATNEPEPLPPVTPASTESDHA